MTSLDFKFREETDDEWMELGSCRGLSDIFFAPWQNVHRLASAAKTRLVRCVWNVRYWKRVAISHVRIENTDSGVARVKRNGIRPGFASLRPSACAPSSPNHSFSTERLYA